MAVAGAPYELPSSVGKTSLPPGAVLVAGLLAVCASAVATQVFAYRLNFHASLGAPIAHYAWPSLRSIYVPWAWVRWAFTFGNPLSKIEYGRPVHEALATLPWTLGIGFAISLLGMIAAVVLFERPAKVAGMTDTGRWATRKDLVREGFLRAAGPIIGGFDSREGVVALRYDGQNGIEHTAVPGDDKTTQLKTNLLIPLQREQRERVAMYGDTTSGRRADMWGEEPSIIALDVKALVDSTSGYQKALGKDVLVFEPLADSNEGRACFNPLWDIRIGTDHESDDAYQAALDLTDADGKGLPTYWDNACTAFGAAVIATLGYRALQQQRPEILSLPSLVDYISSHRAKPGRAAKPNAKPPVPGAFPKDAIEVLIDDLLLPHDPTLTFGWIGIDGKPTSQRAWIVSAALAMQAKAAEERSGVYGSFIEKLGVFRSGMLRKHISTATYTFRDLANRPKPAIVYLKIPAMQLNQFRPLIRIFVRAAIRQMTETSATVDGQEVRGNVRACVVALDEVATLRRDDELATSSGYLRGHGVMLMTLWQSEQQKLQHYGDHEALTPTMGVHIHGRPEKHEDAERLSRALGQFSTLIPKRNSNGGKTSEHPDINTRSLLTATEVKRLPRDYNLIFSRGLTIRARKFPYYKNPTLDRRSRLAAVTTSDVISPKPYFIEHLSKEIGVEKVRNLKYKYVPLPEPPEESEVAIEFVTIPRTDDPVEGFRLGKQAEANG